MRPAHCRHSVKMTICHLFPKWVTPLNPRKGGARLRSSVLQDRIAQRTPVAAGGHIWPAELELALQCEPTHSFPTFWMSRQHLKIVKFHIKKIQIFSSFRKIKRLASLGGHSMWSRLTWAGKWPPPWEGHKVLSSPHLPPLLRMPPILRPNVSPTYSPEVLFSSAFLFDVA